MAKLELFQLKKTKKLNVLFRLYVLGAVALVIAACVLNFKQAIGLLVIASMTVFFLIWDWVMERYGDQMWDAMYPIRHFFNSKWFWMKW